MPKTAHGKPADRAGLLASGNLDDKTQLWDVATRQPIGNSLIGYSLAFNPDGKTLATGSYGHIVRLWNVLSRTGTAALTSNDGAINPSLRDLL